MKRIFPFVLFLLQIHCYAQNNIGTRYNNQNDLNASRYQPSELDLGDKHIQIGLNYNLWTGNTSLDYKTLKEIYKKEKIDREELSQALQKLEKNNLLGIGQEFQVLGLAFQLKSKNDKKTDISISVVDKFALSLRYTDNFMKLVLQGNKQFAGQVVELGPTTLNAAYNREYAVGAAFPLLGNETGFGVRAGLRAKYIQGVAAIHMTEGNAQIYTEKDGRYIDINYDYDVNTAGVKNFSAFNFSGSGYGLDAGLSFYLGKNIQIVTSVLDIGKVHYGKTSVNYSKHSNVRYEGQVVNDFFGEPQSSADSTQDILQPDEQRGKGFNMPLGSKFSIEGEIKTHRNGKDGNESLSNAIFFTYIQGLNNMPGATTRSFFSIGYKHDFRLFDAGVLLSRGGFNKFAGGAFVSVNLGPAVKLGLSSDNLTAVVVPNRATGLDVAGNLAISF